MNKHKLPAQPSGQAGAEGKIEQDQFIQQQNRTEEDKSPSDK
jgi:hypothetical protein